MNRQRIRLGIGLMLELVTEKDHTILLALPRLVSALCSESENLCRKVVYSFIDVFRMRSQRHL